MLAMLLFAPIGDVHEGDDEGLGSGDDEAVGDAAIAQVVTGGDGNRAPGRGPDFLVGRGEAIVEELDGDGFGLLKDDFAVWADDEGGVVKCFSIGFELFFLAAGDEVFGMGAAPILDSFWNGSVKGVFAEDENLRVGMGCENAIQMCGDFEGGREFQLDASDFDGVQWI